MKSTITKNSVAELIYERGDNAHSSIPGCYTVWDHVRNESYWTVDCWDGGEGWSNKKESAVHKAGTRQFVKLTRLYERLLTDDDLSSIASYNEDGSIKKLSKTIANGITITISGPIDGITIDENGTLQFDSKKIN